MRIAEPAIRNPQSEILATRRRSSEIVDQKGAIGELLQFLSKVLRAPDAAHSIDQRRRAYWGTAAIRERERKTHEYDVLLSDEVVDV